MAQKQTQGKYSLYAFPNNSSYTLTGNARSASFGVSAPAVELLTKCISAPNGNNAVSFFVEYKITIKRFRVRMNGAPGIQAGVNHTAAKFKLIFGRVDSDNNLQIYDSVWIEAPNFGEWVEADLIVEPYKRTGGNREFDYMQIIVDPDNSIFYVDDFNLQEDFVGQGITPIIEMEIETSGLFVRSNGEEF